MTAALRATGLSKRYGTIAAVDALDLEVERGVLYGFLGPNGAGKTTTIRMLLGLIFPSAGVVEVLGEPVFPSEGRGLGPGAPARSALRKVGAVVEEPGFWRYVSGRRNLEYFARAAGPRADRRARIQRIDEVLKTVGLDAAANKRYKAYSQGMRQRLGIALALLGAPELLILDEPTNGLDPQGMREIRVLLRRLVDQGTTVFVSSHLLGEVELLCDEVGVLAQGRLVAQGPPAHLRGAPTRVRLEVDDAARARGLLAPMPGVSPMPAPVESTAGQPGLEVVWLQLQAPATAAAVNAALVGAGVAVHALVPEHERLEDVFLDLTEDASAPR